MYTIQLYSPELSEEWNRFIEDSKNGTFLLTRPFMDYHSDRFKDCSLMVYRRGRLYVVLPAAAHGCEVRSHGGLTYGGFLMSRSVTVEGMVEIFGLVSAYYRDMGFSRLIYRPIPHIYHRLPAEEDLYALFRIGAKLIGRDVSSTIFSSERLPIREIRKSGIRKSKKMGVRIEEADDFSLFWAVLTRNLDEKYGVRPVHSLEEIKLLHERFPEQIRLHVAMNGNECVAGVVMFLTENVAHVQYISASSEGKSCGALDLLFSQLINETYADKKYFDFGKSTEDDGLVLNSSLIYQKEGFGARAIVYDTYALSL